MREHDHTTYAAFDHDRLIAHGRFVDVVRAAKETLDAGAGDAPLIFDDHDGRQLEIDFRGTLVEVLARLRHAGTAESAPVARGPGRPKLGVVPREITLLPRHWDWLGRQPGGASALLRRLVERALRGDGEQQPKRQAMEAVDRFMSAMTGNFAGHEEVLRAFYRGDRERFAALTANWPADIRDYLSRLAAPAWNAAVAT